MRKFVYGFIICKKNRKQSVVVDGKQSSLIDVVSGIPHGTVLGPLLLLLHINDLPSVVSSKVRLFADDCLRGDTGVKICEILIFYHFCVFGIIIKIKLFTSM